MPVRRNKQKKWGLAEAPEEQASYIMRKLLLYRSTRVPTKNATDAIYVPHWPNPTWYLFYLLKKTESTSDTNQQQQPDLNANAHTFTITVRNTLH